MKKRILSIFVTVCMLLTMLPTAAFATGSDGTKTTLDVSKGNIVIGDVTLDAYGTDGVQLTTADPDGYIITGTTTSNTVRITGGSHAVHVRELDINATYAAFYIENAHVDLLLLGNCTLDSGNGYYDLHLGANASVTINGNGTLYAGYIGGENGGTITIENGGFDFDRVYTGGIGTITIKGGIYKYGYPDENCVGMQKVPVAERYKVIEDSTRAWPYEVVHEGYNISFHAGDGGSGTMGSLTGVSGSYTLPKCTFTPPAGKVFAGWSTTENGTAITERRIAMDQDYTFYAQWVNISDAGVAIDETNFPDATFRDYVAANFDINQNGYLSDADISAATEINVMGKSITSLTGVEHFTALTKLKCDTNQLTSLDISKNTSLLELDCGANQLTALDVSNNTLLAKLTCNANQLTSLDVSKNTQLSDLECSYNKLTSLDVSKNTVLTYLGCNANELTTLDVSNNTGLEQLECSNNQLTALDLSMNSQLSTLFCSGNAYLISVGADRNFDLKNLPGDFDVTKASNWTGGTVEGNILKVKPDTTSVTYTYATGFDGSVIFTLNVLDTSIQGVLVNESNFPDAVFRDYVSTQFDTNNDSSLSKEEIDAAKEISVTRKTITSLQGIEHFTALTKLYCDNCQLTSLDVSKNIALTILSCVGNQLTSLDVSRNTNLGQLACNNNQLTSLNVKDSVMLMCSGNTYSITVDSTNRTFDLNNLPGSFDISKVVIDSWTGGTVSGNILTVDAGTSQVTYTYACGGSYYGGEGNGIFTLAVTEGSTYTVTLNANGGTGNDVVKSGVVGNYNLPDCPFTAPNGQQFKGWAIAANGEVIAGTTITVSANTDLYAIWEDIPVVTVSSIAVNNTTHKVEYTVGDTLDVTGLTILVTKSDSSTETVNVTTDMVSGFDSTSAVDRQTLTITYEGKTTTYDISIAAAPVTKYQVTVTNGTGGGEYAEDETVTVTANDPEQGKRFKEWQVVSGGVTLADATQSTTTFTMPANAVEVKAVYEDIPPVTVSSIAVNSNAHKVEYTVGDTLDVTGLTILVTKSDSSTETVNVTTSMVSGFDSTSAVASQTLTITYEGKTTTYDISIAAAPVTKYLVTVTNGTGGGEYTEDAIVTVTANAAPEGQQFAGWQVVSGGVTLTDATATETTFTMPANAVSVTATYEDIPVTVSSIAVNSDAHKTAYTVGDSLDVTGLTILVTKSDSSTETVNVTSGMVSGFDSTAAVASQTLTITYEGKTTTYNISVAAAPVPTVTLTGIAVTTAPAKTVYTAGEVFDAAGMVITATYSDGTTKAVTNYTVEGGSDLDQGQTSVTISYTEGSVTKTTTQAITVNAVVTFTLTPSATSISGGGTVTILANKPVKQGTFTCSGGITVAQVGDLSFTASLPNATATYTFSAEAIDGTTATCTVSVTRYTSGGGGGGGGAAPSTPATPVTGTEANPTASIVNGTATAAVTEQAVETVIENASKSGEDTIVIAPEVKGDAEAVKVELPKNSVKDIAEDTDAALSVETDLGDVTIPNAALASIVEQAGGSKITIEVTQAKAEDVKEHLDPAHHADAIVVEVKIQSGSKNITGFGGQSITLELPRAEKHAPGRRYLVIAISDNGRVSRMIADCAAGSMKLKTSHLTTFAVTTEEMPVFTDVDLTQWYGEAVDYAVANGLMAGYGNGLFGTNDTTSRGMIVTILYRQENSPVVEGANPFTDVADGKYYRDAVVWAEQNGIVGGYGGGLFGPDDPITREQLAAILWRYAKYKGWDVSVGENTNILSYNDAFDISEYAIPAMQWACGAGVLQGDAENLMPQGDAKRRHAAAMLMRFLESEKE